MSMSWVCPEEPVPHFLQAKFMLKLPSLMFACLESLN